MKVTHITIAVVGTLTMLLLAPFDAKASVQGVGQSSHFSGQHLVQHQFRPHHHRAFGQWPWCLGVPKKKRCHCHCLVLQIFCWNLVKPHRGCEKR